MFPVSFIRGQRIDANQALDRPIPPVPSHTHPPPDLPDLPDIPAASGTVRTERDWDQPASQGTDSKYSRGDHTHGTPPLSIPTGPGFPRINFDRNGFRLFAYSFANIDAYFNNNGLKVNTAHAKYLAVDNPSDFVTWSTCGLRVTGEGYRSGLSIETNTSSRMVYLKLYDDSDALQIRNRGDTGFSEIRASGFTVSSSKQSKRAIRTLTRSGDAISKLRAVRFRRPLPKLEKGATHDSNAKSERLGFIAEEVAEHLPEAVSLDGAGKPMGIDYSVIVAALVKTVQEQAGQLASMQEQLSSLKSEVDELKRSAPRKRTN